MKFNQGANVYTPDGEQVGRVDRVVIDPKTEEVTHIVIRKGFLFTQDKVVPVDSITEQGERLTLRMDTEKLKELPEFEETHYVMLNEEELAREVTRIPAHYYYPPYAESPVAPYADPPYITKTQRNIPEGTVAVKQGAKVISRDGKHLGSVEQVLTTQEGDQVTHFLISKGLLLKEKKMIPVGWIDTFDEDEVRLLLRARTVEELPTRDYTQVA